MSFVPNELVSYLNEDNVVNSFGFLVRSFREVLVDVLEVRYKNIFNEMFILLNIVVF